MRKQLVIGVILLFIGVGIAPSITANIENISSIHTSDSDDELIEYTVELFGIKGIRNHTVMLTKQQSKELDALFDYIKDKIETAKTREEAEEIFNEAIIELNKYGLLGDLSIKQVQKLVIGRYKASRTTKILEKIYTNIVESDSCKNYICLVAGDSDYSFFYGLLATIRIIMAYVILPSIYLYLPYIIPFLVPLLKKLGFDWYDIDFWEHLLGSIIDNWPVHIGGGVTFGRSVIDWWSGIYYNYPANGWVKTFGLFLKKSLEGQFYGQISTISLSGDDLREYLGIAGFFGIKITEYNSLDSFFLGFALQVDLGPNPP